MTRLRVYQGEYDPHKVDIPPTTITCPYHGADSHFTVLEKRWAEPEVWTMQKCDQCGRVVYLSYSVESISSGSDGFMRPKVSKEPVDIYPALVPKTHEAVENKVASAYIEAIKSLNAGAPNACAVMCRRALQSGLIEKGADQKKRLYDQIDQLKGSCLSDSIADWAHEIRELGNIGAHEDKYEPEGISSDTAKELVDFTEEMLDHLYIKPWKIEQRRKERIAKKKGI